MSHVIVRMAPQVMRHMGMDGMTQVMLHVNDASRHEHASCLTS